MTDNFYKISKGLKKQMNEKKSQIQKQHNFVPREIQESKKQIIGYQEKLNDLNTLIKQYEKNSDKYNLTLNQILDRKKEYQMLEALKDEINKMIDNPDLQKKQLFNKNDEKVTFKKAVALPGRTNKEIQDGYQQLRDDKYKYVDNLNEQLENTKYIGKNMKEEIGDHIQKIDEIDNNVNKNTFNMLSTTKKIKKIIKKSKKCVLITAIIIEIVLLILVIIFV